MANDTERASHQLDALSPKAVIDALSGDVLATLDHVWLDANVLASVIDPIELGPDQLHRFFVGLSTAPADVPALELDQLGSAEFARLVSRASRRQLEAVVDDSGLWRQILNVIFARISTHIKPARAQHVQAVVHWRVTGGTGEDGFDRYETIIANGAASGNKRMREKPRVTITIAPVDFIKLVTGQTTPAVLFVTGRIKVKGDLAFAAGLIRYFDIPKL